MSQHSHPSLVVDKVHHSNVSNPLRLVKQRTMHKVHARRPSVTHVSAVRSVRHRHPSPTSVEQLRVSTEPTIGHSLRNGRDVEDSITEKRNAVESPAVPIPMSRSQEPHTPLLFIKKTRGAQNAQTRPDQRKVYSVKSEVGLRGRNTNTLQITSQQPERFEYGYNERGPSHHPAPPTEYQSEAGFDPGVRTSQSFDTGRDILAATEDVSDSPIRAKTLKRRQSIKQRVLTKVMAGLQGKENKPTGDGHSDKSLLRRLSLKSASSASTNLSFSQGVEPSGATTSIGSVLPGTVSPTTQKKNLSQESAQRIWTSPIEEGFLHKVTPSEASSITSRRIRTSSSGILLPQSVFYSPSSQLTTRPTYSAASFNDSSQNPLQQLILQVELDIVPEREDIHHSNRTTMWAAVEIRSRYNTVPPNFLRVNNESCLDVVVIIDNLEYASSACLSNACSIVIQLAKCLGSIEDRIAVLCTTCRHANQNNNAIGCLLHPLRRTRLRTLEKELQLLREPLLEQPSHCARLSDTLSEAIKMLKHSDSPKYPPLREHCAHVFLLSPNPAGCFGALQDIGPMRTHLICPAVIPYSMDIGPASAWPLNQPLLKLTSMLSAMPADHQVLQGHIQHVIAQARHRWLPGNIRDVQIRIDPLPGCTIGTVQGDLAYSTLQPEDTRRLLVQVDINEAKTDHTLTSMNESSSKRPSSLDSAFSDLEVMLGETTLDLFSVDVSYKHSMFSDNTDLIIRDTCRVRQHNPTSEWSKPKISEGQADPYVREKLAYSIATRNSPDLALIELDEMADCFKHIPCGSDYIQLIREELEHHSHVLQKRESSLILDRDPAQPKALPFPRRPTVNEEHNQSPVPAEGLQLQNSSPDSNKTIIHKRSMAESIAPEPADEAHKIWRHMRRDSRSYRPLAPMSESALNRLAAADEHMRELRRQAVKNKRSVGADTLRSLALSASVVQEGGVAPWL